MNTLISFPESLTGAPPACSGYYQPYDQAATVTPLYPDSLPESYYPHQPEHLVNIPASYPSGFQDVDRSGLYCGESPGTVPCESGSPQAGPCGSPLSGNYSSPQTEIGSPSQVEAFSDGSPLMDQRFKESPEQLASVPQYTIPDCSAGYQIPVNPATLMVSQVI